jgi:hypothetical protein
MQIAIGLFHVSFRFSDDVAVSGEGEFSYSMDKTTGVASPSAVRSKSQAAPYR